MKGSQPIFCVISEVPWYDQGSSEHHTTPPHLAQVMPGRWWHGITSVVEEELNLMLPSLHFYPPAPISHSEGSSGVEVIAH